MRNTRQTALVKCIILFLLPLSGCSTIKGWFSPKRQSPPTFELTLHGSADLNPDSEGAPLITKVLILQLTDSSKAKVADLRSLARHAKETLDKELLSIDDISLKPSDTKRISIARNSDVKYLAVVGNFRTTTGLTWRSIVEVSSDESAKPLEFYLDKYSICTREKRD
jgi:type VI secretion system VasD/TssJ family lipoprotein